MMTESRDEQAIKRILLALDASTQCRDLLEAAAEFAADMQAELDALFVEDANLFRLAELPFVREIGTVSPRAETLSLARMERELRALARQAEAILATTAKRRSIAWRFRVVRGQVRGELLSAAEASDLVTMGRGGSASRSRSRLGSTARAIAMRSSSPVLLLHTGQTIQPPVYVLYDGTAAGRDALVTAARLNRSAASRIAAIVVGETDALDQLQTQAQQLLEARQQKARFRQLSDQDINGLAGLLNQAQIGILVLPAPSALLQEDALQGLLDRVPYPVMLVR
jgi:nucleotide-binding universal stress UspA family protein